MTWPVIARRDVAVLRADNSLLLFAGFFALLAGGIAYGSTNGPAVTPFPDVLALLFLFAIPLTAATLVHEAVPSAVVTGRARTTLSLPHTRSTFLAGAGAARLAVTLGAAVTAAVVGAAVYLVRGAALSPFRVLAVLALAALLGAAFVAATLAFTARSTSTTLAAATAYGFFMLSFFWPVALSIGQVVLADQFGVEVGSRVVDALVVLSPIYAYANALTAVNIDTVATTGVVPDVGSVAVLFAWVVLGFALAARRFDRVDL